MPVSRTTTEGMATEVMAAYARVEARLLGLIAKYLAADANAPDWVERKLLQVGTLRRRLERELAAATAEGTAEVTKQVTRAYVLGQAAGQGDVDGLGIALESAPTQAEAAVSALVRDTTDRLNLLGVRVLRESVDAYRDAVRRAAAGTLTGATTRLQDAQVALDDLARRGVASFTDNAGRSWSMATYTEMATRTATARASVTGHLDRLADAGLHLVIVSNSPRECETCRPWEGKVLSTQAAVPAIMGNPATGESERVQVDGTVDQATADGLFHPNCTHSLSAYLPGVTKAPTSTANPKGDAERQELRRLERQTREWKRRQAVAITPEAKAKADGKVREWQARIASHTSSTGLIRQRQREQITRAR